MSNDFCWDLVGDPVSRALKSGVQMTASILGKNKRLGALTLILCFQGVDLSSDLLILEASDSDVSGDLALARTCQIESKEEGSQLGVVCEISMWFIFR